ncbi:putative kinetochore protein NUF2 [Nosema granulosis]|uniref:Kinetochore protein NUF2 n=1 Tax=Nosema granulosis TaxID=83296 RepID=A0A9P6H1T4_9MICR|nr:putative kinetochore protein NUF2 [Nosema granulosis]
MPTKVPDLPVKEIIQYFSELDITIKQADLLKPSYQFVTSLYEGILGIYTSQNVFGNLVSDINMEDQEDSIYLILLYKKMYNFMCRIGVEDFSIKDFSPETKRLIGILSSVINFSMYRDSKKHVYEKMYKVSEEREVIKREVETKIKKKEQELRKCTGEFEVQKGERSKLEQEIAELEENFREVVKIQKILVSETDKLKTERDESNDKLNSLQLLIMNIKQDVACLSSQVVEDPSKLISLLKEMKELVNKEGDSLKELECNKAKYLFKIGSLKTNCEELKQILSLSRNIKDCDKEIEAFKRQIDDIGSNMSNTESSINVCKIRLNHLERQISHIESKLSNLQEIDRRCADEISDRMVNLKNDYEKLSTQRTSMQSKIDQNYNQMKAIEQEIVKTRNEHENEVNDLLNMFCNLKDKQLQSFNEIRKYFEE